MAKRILFVPGKNPKPHPQEHRTQLLRCLMAGLGRADEAVAAELERACLDDEACFALVPWNFLYYGEYKSLEADLPWIDVLIAKPQASAEDKAVVHEWGLKLSKAMYLVGDHLPWLIALLPSPEIRATIRETEAYFRNHGCIADRVRELLKAPLRKMLAAGDELLVIGHSMGSVIAYDALWELSQGEGNHGKIDFLTIGSPLGMHFVQRRILGTQAPMIRINDGSVPQRKYPANIRRWVNIYAMGDLTTLDQGVTDYFGHMQRLGLCEVIEDVHEGIYNYFRNDEGVNVHRSYGYLANRQIGEYIARWWRAPRQDGSDGRKDA